MVASSVIVQHRGRTRTFTEQDAAPAKAIRRWIRDSARTFALLELPREVLDMVLRKLPPPSQAAAAVACAELRDAIAEVRPSRVVIFTSALFGRREEGWHYTADVSQTLTLLQTARLQYLRRLELLIDQPAYCPGRARGRCRILGGAKALPLRHLAITHRIGKVANGRLALSMPALTHLLAPCRNLLRLTLTDVHNIGASVFKTLKATAKGLSTLRLEWCSLSESCSREVGRAGLDGSLFPASLMELCLDVPLFRVAAYMQAFGAQNRLLREMQHLVVLEVGHWWMLLFADFWQGFLMLRALSKLAKVRYRGYDIGMFLKFCFEVDSALAFKVEPLIEGQFTRTG